MNASADSAPDAVVLPIQQVTAEGSLGELIAEDTWVIRTLQQRYCPRLTPLMMTAARYVRLDTSSVTLGLTEGTFHQGPQQALERGHINNAHVECPLRNERSSQQAATEKALTPKRRNWNEVAGRRIETLNLGPVDRILILKHLVSKVRLEMSERYSPVFKEYDIVRTLERALNPIVKDICEQGKFGLARYA